MIETGGSVEEESSPEIGPDSVIEVIRNGEGVTGAQGLEGELEGVSEGGSLFERESFLTLSDGALSLRLTATLASGA